MSASAVSSAAAGSTVITVTVGNNSGFQSATFGSVSPAVLYAQNIMVIACSLGNTQVTLNGVVAASFFNNVTFKYGASGNTASIFTTASATFTNPGGTSSQWVWTGTTFSATDNGLARFVIFYR